MSEDTERDPIWQLLPMLLAGGAAALLAYQLGRAASRTRPLHDMPGPSASSRGSPTELRNAGLTYRPIGDTGTPYPAWVRALKGKSGVYVIRETNRDGSSEVVYVGESHTDRLYQTLTRHFQSVRHEAQEAPMT